MTLWLLNHVTIGPTQNINIRNFPGGAVDKNPSAHVGDTGSIPSPGRCHVLLSSEARAPQLLSPRSRAREPQLWRPMCLQPVSGHKRGHHDEEPVHCSQSTPTQSSKDPAQPEQKREKKYTRVHTHTLTKRNSKTNISKSKTPLARCPGSPPASPWTPRATGCWSCWAAE